VNTFKVGSQFLNLLLISVLDLLEVMFLVFKSDLILLFLIDQEEIGLFEICELLNEVKLRLKPVLAISFIQEILKPRLNVHFISRSVLSLLMTLLASLSFSSVLLLRSNITYFRHTLNPLSSLSLRSQSLLLLLLERS